MRPLYIFAIFNLFALALSGCASLTAFNPIPILKRPIPAPSSALASSSDYFADSSGVRKFRDLEGVSASASFEVAFENVPFPQAIQDINRLDAGYIFYYVQSSPTSGGGFFSTSRASSPVFGESSEAPKQERLANGYFKGTIQEIVRDFSIANGLTFERIDNRYYISESPIALENCYVVCSVESNYDQNRIDSLLMGTGQDLRCVANGSRVVLCGRLGLVKMARDLILELNEERRAYVATVSFYRCSRSDVARLSASITASSVDLLSRGLDVFDVFNAQLDFANDKQRLANYSQQVLYCSDQSTSSFSVGTEQQKETRAISDAGTSTVSGYQTFRDGVEMEIKPLRSIGDYLECELKFSNSKFQGESLARDQIDLQYQRVAFKEGALYYVASLKTDDKSNSSNFFGFGGRSSEDVLTVWVSFRAVDPVAPIGETGGAIISAPIAQR